MIIREPGRRHIGIFDVHVPRNNPIDGVLKFAHDTGCDHFIVGGDFLNLEWASHWNESLFKEFTNRRLMEMLDAEVKAGAKVLGEIRHAVGKRAQITFIPGNHESWLWYAAFHHRFVQVPIDTNDVTFRSDLSRLMNDGLAIMLQNMMGTKALGIKVLPYNEPLQIGKVVYMHGHQFGGADPTKTSAKRWPHVSMVFGHHHTHLVTTIYNGGDQRDVHQHVCVPALTELSPGYLRDPSTRWLNGFFVADFKDGFFDGRVIKVFNGKMISRT